MQCIPKVYLASQDLWLQDAVTGVAMFVTLAAVEQCGQVTMFQDQRELHTPATGA